MAFGVIFILTSAWVWHEIRTTPDNGYERLVAYLEGNVPAGSRVSVTTQTSKFLLPRHDVGKWVTNEALREQRVQFVVVSSKQVADGYAYGSPDFFQ